MLKLQLIHLILLFYITFFFTFSFTRVELVYKNIKHKYM